MISIYFPIGVFCFSVLYWIVPKKIKSYLLLLSGLGLYFYADHKGFMILLSMILISFLFGLVLGQEQKKGILLLAIISNFLPLLFFKVITFQRFYAINIWNLVMPLGLSYYSFKSVSYLCDIYHKKIETEKNIAKYALFMSFFPEIFVGPIDRAGNLLKQINKGPAFQWDKMKSGAILMAYGYFEKVVIADRLALYVDAVYDNLFYDEVQVYQGLFTVTAVIFYSLQIYFDFAGCTNIVRGMGYLLGFELPENFKQPYLSTSVTEFWRKWHISLTSWLRDYIYIPLGGNRKGILRKFINITVVFVVCAIWHGIGIHFLIWGLLNATFQIFEAIIGLIVKAIKNDKVENGPNLETDKAIMKESNKLEVSEKELIQGKKSHFTFDLVKGIYTFVAISFTWIFFRAGNVGQALTIVKSIFSKWNPWSLFDHSIYLFVYNDKNWYLLLGAMLMVLVIDIFGRVGISVRKKMEQQSFILQLLIIYGLIFGTILLGAYGNGYDSTNFIYQSF